MKPELAGAGCRLGLSIIRRGMFEGSGARGTESGVRSDTGALVRIPRFRLRYSRIHAALSAGSR